MRRSILLNLLLVIATTIAGCSSGASDVPPLGKVTGLVTMDGQPVVGAVVEFQPANGRPSSGTTDDQGRYELIYTNELHGAIVGSHKVKISTPQYVLYNDASTTENKESIPAKYNTQTTLSAEVTAGSNDIGFQLTK